MDLADVDGGPYLASTRPQMARYRKIDKTLKNRLWPNPYPGFFFFSFFLCQ